MRIHFYDPQVKVLWATPSPTEVVTQACSVTQQGVFASEAEPNAALMKFLYTAEHGSPLEHAVICMDITQISRACADQLRTHRMASHTMSSTHYQDHRAYHHRVEACENGVNFEFMAKGIEAAVAGYEQAVDNGMPKEAARQCLPLSIEVRHMLTINARSLANFIRLRSCYRNTMEMVLLAERMRMVALNWFEDLFKWVDKPCVFEMCHEGKMHCDYKTFEARKVYYEQVNQR